MPEGSELLFFLATVTLQVWLQAGQKYHIGVLLGKPMQAWLSIGQRFQDLNVKMSRSQNSDLSCSSKSFPEGELQDSPALSSWSLYKLQGIKELKSVSERVC